IVGVTSDATIRHRREERRTFLAEATALLTRSLDVEETLAEIAHSAVPHLAAWCTVHLEGPDGGPVLATVAHADPERLAEAREIARRYPPDPRAETGVPAVLRSGRPEVHPHISDELLVAAARDDEHLAMMRSLRMRAAMMVPLVSRGRTLGVLSFIASDAQGAYDQDDLALAEELGRRAGLALENARLHAHARDVAVTLQRSLLPGPPPQVAGLDIAVRYLPGQEGTEVGGDWYDVVVLPDGQVVLIVGDVEGRGTKAAARMGRLRAVLRAYVFDAEGPADALQRLDLLLGEQPEPEFATVIIAAVAADRRALVLASAGHLPPVLLPPQGGPRLAPVAPGVPIGAPSAERLETQLALEPRTRILLYTDGLVERRSAPLGQRLDALLAAAADAPPGTDPLLDHITARMHDAAQKDDVALLAAHLAP
ncbi:MAG TPA: GAF domain-containing SpoIIE family protein phosphatase, partial [Baekduia sp.]|nr:GAF domain-containing SpoIIE family protein phosphatase [Baekduia sp.]